jgi:hypothetical protein
VSKTATAWLDGDKAAFVVTDPQPVFHFRFPVAGAPSNFPGGGPEEYALVRMQAKDEKRSVQIGRFWFGTMRAGVNEDEAIPVDVQKVSASGFTVRPKTALKPGEYCFFRVPANTMDVMTGVGGKMWAFGIWPVGVKPGK